MLCHLFLITLCLLKKMLQLSSDRSCHFLIKFIPPVLLFVRTLKLVAQQDF